MEIELREDNRWLFFLYGLVVGTAMSALAIGAVFLVTAP
jgi:hypothetical protein